MVSAGTSMPDAAATAMIFKHYAKFIRQDGPDVVGMLNKSLGL